MSLKQSIVVVNEYTIKNKSGKGGSRGGTPGDYVLRYMARNGAVEDLTPVQFDSETYIERYMARDSATETCDSVSGLKSDMKKIDGNGGVAFGYGDYSLSHKKLAQCSKDIQAQFDKGKTVFKTVVSFDEKFLRKYGIISDDFEFKERGDYRGHIDQMKLRMAIMNGLDRVSRHFDDLRYIGVIQVDTAHVHCHLAMVDAGVGHIMPDGTQRGKLTQKQMDDMRRGIDMYLDDKQKIRMMSSNITHDKRNALCYIKKYTHRIMEERGFGQFIIACLPDDKRLWRANTNRKEMQKPNAIVREYVMQLLNQPNSGYKDALEDIKRYVRSRQSNESLSNKQARMLQKEGQDRLINNCMNAVYTVLKNIPETSKTVWTKTLDTMSLNYADMADKVETDPMIEFGFKLRSYSSRLSYHREKMQEYHEGIQDIVENNETVSQDAQVLLDFMKFEEDYNDKLMCKYQHFLRFLPPGDVYKDEFDAIGDKQFHISNMKKLKDDKSISRMSQDSLEQYGRQVYNVTGASMLLINQSIYLRRIEKEEEEYQKMVDKFKQRLKIYGLSYDGKGVVCKPTYDFEDVKALDIHHLGYDFAYEFAISYPNVKAFVDCADERYDLYQKTKAYLEATDQEDALGTFQCKDIEIMKRTADRIRGDSMFRSSRGSGTSIEKSSNTFRLDEDYTEEIRQMISNAVHDTVQMDNFEREKAFDENQHEDIE